MKKLLILTLAAILYCLLAGNIQAQSVESKTVTLTSGTGTWTAPAGTWKVTKLEAWGGGGGGGNATTARSVGAGGGSGAYAAANTDISVVPGAETLYYSVGSAGTGGKRGDTSYVKEYISSTSYYVRATGGYAGATVTISGTGATSTSTATATSNLATALDGDTKTSGKKGSNGTITRTRSGFLVYSYSFSGTGGAGGNNVDGTGSGSARTTAGAGNGASAVGAGGGGALNTSTSTQSSYTGGTGGSGQVRISYQVLTLTVHFDLNYNGGTNPDDQTVLYYDAYGTLPTATRDNHIFLGWFTEATGGTQVTSTTACTSTTEVTLHAHWASTGAIAGGQTTVKPCENFTVYEETAPDDMGQTIVYSWGYSLNGGEEVSLNTNTSQLTQAYLTLNQMGSYVFTRYVNVLEQKVASAGNYTVNVLSVDPGAIAPGELYTCTTGGFSITSVTDASTTSEETLVYEWRYSKDGGAEVTVSNSDKTTLTQADVAWNGDGAYVFKRYATIGCAEPVAATGSYTVHVTTLPTSYAAPTCNHTGFCTGGELVVTGADYTLGGATAPHNLPTTFNWMISKDGAAAETAGQSTTLTQELNYAGSYDIYANVVYFNDNACSVSTATKTVTVVADPTLTQPTLNATEVCPSGEVSLTAADPAGGVGGDYTYSWQFLPDGGNDNDWEDIGASQATYSDITGNPISAGNFLKTGSVQYRTYIHNALGCDAHSDAVGLNIIVVEVPVVTTAQDVCPAPGDTAFTTMVSTTQSGYELYWYASADANATITAPTASLQSENVVTYYAAQYNPDNHCTSARVPVTLTITYTAHLGHTLGDLDQTVCQNSAMETVTFSHSGDCAPQVTWSPAKPDGVTVTSANGTTRIEGTPAEAGTFTYHVELHPDEQTVCAAPNYFDGSLLVNPVYAVTVNQAICDGSYTLSDNQGNSYTYTESGTYTQTLEAVTGCDSVVTLNLYVHEWNQFGFKENEELIAGWTNFSSVSSPIAADVTGSVAGSQITYSGWNGSNSNSQGNLSSTSPLITASGNSLGLINGTYTSSTLNMNNGKHILVQTRTSGYGNVNLKFDYGVDRTQFISTWSDNDRGFTSVQILYSLDNNTYYNLPALTIDLEEAARTYGSYEVNLSDQSSYAIENTDNVYLKFVFDGAAKSTFGTLSAYTNYFLIDNICISGTPLNELELDGETEACTNQSLTLVATPPYTNTNVNPPVTTPVVYKWERIKDGERTVLDETSNVLVDEDVQAGDYQYQVSVGESPCGQTATLNVHGIVPAYRLDIVRHGTVCANEVDQVSNITFTDDCQYVEGMFIVTPQADEMRAPGTYQCQLSIPTTENPCDSIITLELEVLKAFDTTVVANICLGETYSEFGFDITPTEEGIAYYTSDPSWTCSSGCDSVYRLTLITNSVRQTLTSESGVTLAAWPMDKGVNNFTPACGVKTTGSSFMVYGGSNIPPFANETGHAPANDYCYSAASSNGALRWPNIASSCSGLFGTASYTDYGGAYFEIKINPYDYENLKLKFDYMRENSTSSGSAFSSVSYSYKFAEGDSYTSLGSRSMTSTAWSSVTLDFSSAASLDHDVMFLKVEFNGGSPGNTESCGTFSGSKYLPSYITVDNVVILADRPARATLDGNAQTCDKTYVCEGDNEVTFTCQGDDAYFKFYVVDETTGTETAFNGAQQLVLTPTQTTTYTIKAVERTTGCDSVWGPFPVEVVKEPSITYVSGSYDAGICGDAEFDNEIQVKDATSYTFTWLTAGNATPDGVVYNDNGSGVITIGGTLANGGSANYYIEASPDSRCPTGTATQAGTISARVMPVIEQVIGTDTVCQNDTMQFVIANQDELNFTLVPESERYVWATSSVTLAHTDTLAYRADESTHSTRHYLTVRQNGCVTVDSVDVVVYNFNGDTLKLNGGHYVLNYGDIFLVADSLKLPDLMHKGEVVPGLMIESITHNGGEKIYPNNETDLTTYVTWTITDKCGGTHQKTQTLTFELPPCGDADHFTVTDVDGNEYATVRVGLNCWMRENLRTLHYADNESVAVALAYINEDYPDAEANAAVFGRLYSWYSAMRLEEGSTALPQLNANGRVQGVCPDGWFVPTPQYFTALHDIDMDHLRTDTYWLDGGGDNSTGYSTLPAGYYNSEINRYENLLGNAYFWSADLTGSGKPKTFMADCHCYMWQVFDTTPADAYSIRCLKDKE